MDKHIKSSIIPLGVKIVIFILFLSKFPIFISLPLFIFLNYIYYFILHKNFGYQKLTGYDKVFLTNTKSSKVTLIIKLKFSNFNVNKMKDFIYEKLISKISRFRSKLIFKFYEYYFKEEQSQENIKDNQIIINKDIKEEEIENIIQNEVNNPFDIFNELPYKFLLYNIENTNEGIVLFKYDHILSDGLGVICSLCLISDNFKVDLYPKLLQRMKSPNLLQNIYLNLISIFYVIKIIFLDYKTQISKNKIFRDIEKSIDTSSIIIGEKFNLKDFENYRKKNKVSFNDIMINAFINTLSNIGNNNLKKVSIVLPVGITVPPTKIKDVQMLNQARWVSLKLPVTDNMKIINKNIKKSFSPEMLFSLGKLDDLQSNIFNIDTLNSSFIYKTLKYDFVFTNIPGPTNKLIYNNMLCEEMLFYSNAGWGLPFILIFSYNGQFRTVISFNKEYKENVSNFLKKFNEQTKNFII